MGLFGKQLANVVEWENSDDETIFWKWHNSEIKKDSRLVIRPGQDALFLYNGRIEGVFKEEGNYEIESQIVPFLSSLKGFKFGFQSGLRAEVLFVNTREFLIKWGTRNAVLLPVESLPGGLPVRCYGTLTLKVSDYVALIDQVAGVSDSFRVEEVRERVLNVLDGYLMKWIAAEGKNLLDLQASAEAIGKGIQMDLDMELMKIGLSVSRFYISSFSYPAEIQERINDLASIHMIGDTAAYQRVKAIDALGKSGAAGDMAGAIMGASVAAAAAQQAMQAAQNTKEQEPQTVSAGGGGKNFCSQCGTRLSAGAKFCSNCGAKIE